MGVPPAWYVRRLDLKGRRGSWRLVFGDSPSEVVCSILAPKRNPLAVLVLANEYMEVIAFYYQWRGCWKPVCDSEV